jgi:hypothetical protein
MSAYPFPDQYDVWLPLNLNYFKPVGLKRKHHIETGIGHALQYQQFNDGSLKNPWRTYITAKAGYRFQKPTGTWIFKILFTPFLEYNSKEFRTIKKTSFDRIFTGDNPYPWGGAKHWLCLLIYYDGVKALLIGTN